MCTGSRAGADDPRFNQTFEAVFTAAALQVPWFLCLGNHDWNGNTSAQVEYTKVSERWNMPNMWHTFVHRFTASSTTTRARMSLCSGS